MANKSHHGLKIRAYAHCPERAHGSKNSDRQKRTHNPKVMMVLTIEFGSRPKNAITTTVTADATNAASKTKIVPTNGSVHSPYFIFSE